MFAGVSFGTSFGIFDLSVEPNAFFSAHSRIGETKRKISFSPSSDRFPMFTARDSESQASRNANKKSASDKKRDELCCNRLPSSL